MQKLTEEEQKLFRLYGKLPTHKNILTRVSKVWCEYLTYTSISLNMAICVTGSQVLRLWRLCTVQSRGRSSECGGHGNSQSREVCCYTPLVGLV
jgi:hypothetical protein